MAVLLLLLTLFLAFANGANDVSKGIATLFGSSVTNYRRSVAWGTIWTVAGAMTAAVATQALVATFSGKGLLAKPASEPAFLLAVAFGAIAWLIIATRTGLPVSTTHALTGALCGVGIAAQGINGVLWTAVALKTAIPLALSPLMALLIVLMISPLIRMAFARPDSLCVCVEEAAAAGTNSVLPELVVARECGEAAAGVRIKPLEATHWLSSGATSFFRGMNDTPKIVALGVAAAATVGMSSVPLYGAVAMAMGAGSLLWGFRVTRTLAERVTPISASEGLTANMVAAVLVASASFVALPVSTTHVSSGAILGAGVARGGGDVRWKTVGEMLLAWLVTLPLAALLGWTIYRLIA